MRSWTLDIMMIFLLDTTCERINQVDRNLSEYERNAILTPLRFNSLLHLLGDLILFRTSSLSASLTRYCTDSPFDHVAMILRTSEGYRTVECTSSGIGCWILQERVDDWIIKGVVIRRLQTVLTNEMVSSLNEFLQSVKHKPYKLNSTLLSRMVRTCLCCARKGQNERGLEGEGDGWKRKDGGRGERDDGEEEEEEEEEKSSQPPPTATVDPLPRQSVSNKYTSPPSPSPPAALQHQQQQHARTSSYHQSRHHHLEQNFETAFAAEEDEEQVAIPPLLPPLHRENSRVDRAPSISVAKNGAAAAAPATSPPTTSPAVNSLPTDLRHEQPLSPRRRTRSGASASNDQSTASPCGLFSSPADNDDRENSPNHPQSPSPPLSSSPSTRDSKYLIELHDHESIRSHYPHSEDISSLHLRSGFFCSSFIAACYMRMGLLPAYPPIDWYLPNTFSSQTAIQPPLINAEFGEETLVAKPTKDRSKKKWTNQWKEKDRKKSKLKREKRILQEANTRVELNQQQQLELQVSSSSSGPISSSSDVSSTIASPSLQATAVSDLLLPAPIPTIVTATPAAVSKSPSIVLSTIVSSGEYRELTEKQNFMRAPSHSDVQKKSSRSTSPQPTLATEDVATLATSAASHATSIAAPVTTTIPRRLSRSIIVQLDRSAESAISDGSSSTTSLGTTIASVTTTISSPSLLPNQLSSTPSPLDASAENLSIASPSIVIDTFNMSSDMIGASTLFSAADLVSTPFAASLSNSGDRLHVSSTNLPPTSASFSSQSTLLMTPSSTFTKHHHHQHSPSSGNNKLPPIQRNET